MKKNMSSTDRIIRIIIVIIIAVLYFAGVISSTLALVLGIIAIIFLLTGLVGFCPLYTICKFSTKKDKSEGEAPEQPKENRPTENQGDNK